MNVLHFGIPPHGPGRVRAGAQQPPERRQQKFDDLFYQVFEAWNGLRGYGATAIP